MRTAAIDAPGGDGLRSRPLAAAEFVLARRGFTPGLTSLPRLALELRRFDRVHAYSVIGAYAGVRAGLPTTFTCSEVLERGNVADRRLRLHVLARAIEGADEVIPATPEVAASLQRWFAA